MVFSLENIQKTLDETDYFMEINGVERKNRLLYKLFLEEQLLCYMDINPEGEYEIRLKKHKRLIQVKVLITGERSCLLDSDDCPITRKLLNDFAKTPEWTYRKGKNIITYFPVVLLPDLAHFKYVLKYMTQNRANFIFAVLLRFLNMALVIIEPILSASIIVHYSNSEIEKIIIFALLLMAQSTLSAVITYFASRLLRKTYGTMLQGMQIELSRNMLGIKTPCIEQNGNGVFSQRLLSETKNVVDNIDNLVAGATEVFRLVGLLVSFAIISVPILIFELILFAIFVFIKYLNKKQLSKDDRAFRTLHEQEVSFVAEMVHAHRDIKLLNSEESFMKRLSATIVKSINVETDMRFKSMGFIYLRNQFLSVTNLIYYIFLVIMMVNYSMSSATALVLFNYNGRMYSSANCIDNIMEGLYQVGLSSERIYQLMNSPDYQPESFGSVHLDKVRGDIEFKNVHFSYDTGIQKTKVLKGINLKINAGESVAFVGQSGCGKTTILSLISRLYDPDSGEILLDGHKIEDLDKDSIRGHISMVSQSPYIFNMSIMENFKIIKDDITKDEMIEACKTACIHEDISRMPGGYDSIVGEGGVTLSGGQRQRIALARSLLKKHSIIMLDEATSALDNMTQKNIQQAIENLRGKSTIIMVAHRLSTVIGCEKLFFIADGQVKACGTHKELLESCEDYRVLYNEEAG